MAKRGKNPDSWRVGKLEQLFRHTGLFLWSLRGSKPNVIITGYSDHWRGAASKGKAKGKAFSLFSSLQNDGQLVIPQVKGSNENAQNTSRVA